MSSQNIKNLTGVSIMNGHFKLQNLLGSGAFGTVYCAVRTSGKGAGKEKFAVKVMPRPEEKSMKKWLLDEELRLQATVGGHKNVVAVKEVSYEVLKGESYACIRMISAGLGITSTLPGRVTLKTRTMFALLSYRSLKASSIVTSVESSIGTSSRKMFSAPRRARTSKSRSQTSD
ncbi:hypothetical protein D9758_010156 [Tetrapyrgos nigripes]|uniref:Protein kinase domain-containing protein n=1 Tax=Tetrapyrgos nigripes TaxID=182062 RepID=A0A8H5CT62_9AGAR|nr:hypothetical protein D9758_010156 [Tetrapyrgos nigripes]